MDEDLDVDVHDVRDRPHLGGTEVPLEIDRVDRKVEHGDLEVVGAAVGSEGVPDGALACRRHAEGVLWNPTRCRDDVEGEQQVHTETWRRSYSNAVSYTHATDFDIPGCRKSSRSHSQ